MKTNKKGLQKFTETENRINLLMQVKKIKQADINKILKQEDIDQFQSYITKLFNKLTGNEKEILLEQVNDILPTDTKNQLWEINHFNIIKEISIFIEEYGIMPTKNNIATVTGLSRQTIHKHLKDFAANPLYAEQMLQFKVMADRVMAKVLKIAVQGEGNVKAARLYFEVLGYLGGQSGLNTKINTQNNYIQINGTVLSQETVKHLKPEQLNAIESIFKNSVKENPLKVSETYPANTKSRKCTIS